MVKGLIKTEGKPCQVDLVVEVKIPCKVRILFFNPKKPNTIYTDRWNSIQKKGEFQVRLPQSSDEVAYVIQCLGSSNGEDVRIVKLDKKKLKQYIPCLSGGKRVNEFIRFAQDFVERLPVLKYGVYQSDEGHYRIDLFPVIKDKGQPMSTPARIHNITGVIEVSKSHFLKYTIPMRMAILLHEFSHYYMNEVQQDEIEADLNGLKMYLGMGYPVIEAHKSFLQVFQGTPTESNKERYEYLKAFIDNFERIKYRICLP